MDGLVGGGWMDGWVGGGWMDGWMSRWGMDSEWMVDERWIKRFLSK